MAKRNFISPALKYKIYSFMVDNDVFSEIDEVNRTCTYAPGWSDEAIAERFPEATMGNIRGIREDAFGSFGRRSYGGKEAVESLRVANDSLRGEVKELSERLRNLEEMIAKIGMKKLEEVLTNTISEAIIQTDSPLRVKQQEVFYGRNGPKIK